MQRSLAAVMIVALLAPAVALAASIGEMPGCCAGGGEKRVTASMACCETLICAAPAPARQPKAVDAQFSPAVITELEPVDVVQPAADPETPSQTASPPPTRIRLALIATLLI